jgi:hypothetical protein
MVFVDRRAGQVNAKTEISYSADRAVIWERFIGKPWTRVSPLEPPRIISTSSGDPNRDGVFFQVLKPGQIYQVVMYRVDTIDPNVSDPETTNRELRPDASVTVLAMLKDPVATDLIVSHDQNVGGTWFRKIVTTRVQTFYVLQVSKVAPFVDSEGIARFLQPLENGTVLDASALHHDREVEPLLPGNDLFYLVRVVDGDGNWQIVSDTFRTKQRKVTVRFEVMHIINDGALGDTTAEFRIWLMEGDNSVKDYFFGNVDNFPISDRPDPGNETQEWIPLAVHCAPFVIGPKDVTDETNRIGLLTRGLIFRTTGPNEVARNWHDLGDGFPRRGVLQSRACFPFPTGGGENVQDVPFVTRTVTEDPDIEFDYDVTAFFTAEYV